MKTALTVVAILMLTLLVLILLIYVLGRRLPVAHVASGERWIPQLIKEVAKRVRDVESHPTWRPEVKKIEVLSPAPAVRYRETSSHGAIVFEFRELVPDAKFESVIADPSLPFGGKWTIELQAQKEGTLVRIREDGEVYSPIFRFLARHAFGHDKTLNAYLDALVSAGNPSALR